MVWTVELENNVRHRGVMPANAITMDLFRGVFFSTFRLSFSFFLSLSALYFSVPFNFIANWFHCFLFGICCVPLFAQILSSLRQTWD